MDETMMCYYCGERKSKERYTHSAEGARCAICNACILDSLACDTEQRKLDALVKQRDDARRWSAVWKRKARQEREFAKVSGGNFGRAFEAMTQLIQRAETAERQRNELLKALDKTATQLAYNAMLWEKEATYYDDAPGLQQSRLNRKEYAIRAEQKARTAIANAEGDK